MCCMKFNRILVCIAMCSKNLVPTGQGTGSEASIALLQELIWEGFRTVSRCYTPRSSCLPSFAEWLSTLALQLSHAFFNTRTVLNCSSRFPLIRARHIRTIARSRNSSWRRIYFSARLSRTYVPSINRSCVSLKICAPSTTSEMISTFEGNAS